MRIEELQDPRDRAYATRAEKRRRISRTSYQRVVRFDRDDRPKPSREKSEIEQILTVWDDKVLKANAIESDNELGLDIIADHFKKEHFDGDYRPGALLEKVCGYRPQIG